MRCPVCRGWLELTAIACTCGFDPVTGAAPLAVERAHQDEVKALLLVLLGLAGVGATAFVLWIGVAVDLRLLVLTFGTAIFGLGRGPWLYFDAQRRLSTANARQIPTPARLLRRRKRR